MFDLVFRFDTTLETDILQQLVTSLHRLVESPDSRSKLSEGLMESTILPLVRRLYTSTSPEIPKCVDNLHSDLLAWAADIPQSQQRRMACLARNLISGFQLHDVSFAPILVRHGRGVDQSLNAHSANSLGQDWVNIRARFLLTA